MTTILIAIVLLLLAGGAMLWLKKPAANPVQRPRQAARSGAPDVAVGAGSGQISGQTPGQTPEPSSRASPTPVAPRPQAARQASTAPRAAAALPATLQQFTLVRREALPAPAIDSLLLRLGQIPRPPLSLQKLLSPAFLESATSAEMSDLIMAEAQIAAKVLATVNSPLYGLKRPVASVGQAVTFLGLNTVRAICLHYMLDDSFKTTAPDRRRRFDAVLRASSLSSELCGKLAQQLELPEQGALVTQGVLSFLGQLAMTALLPTTGPAWGPHADLLVRTQAEQSALGLGAAEVGALLMQSWDLPSSIIDNVRDIDSLLVTPSDSQDPRRGSRLALCYLCARLAERLVHGRLADLASFDLLGDRSVDMLHLQGYLDAPALARLPGLLRSAAVLQLVQKQLGATAAH